MKYKVNDIVLGEVTGIQPYGAFMKIDENEQGLIHISEISPYFVKNIHDYVKVGQKIKVKIIDILEEKDLYRLSLKQVETRVRQNIRPLKTPPNKKNKKRFKIPLDQQDFSPLQEALEGWIDDEITKIEKEN